MAAASITSAQLRAGRALLKIEQQDLSGRAGVSIATLRRMEGADGQLRGSYENVSGVVAALEAAGVEFIPENGGGAGVRLKKRAAAVDASPKPIGTATDAVDAMDEAINVDRSKPKR